MARIAIIIVNYGTADLTIEAVESVLARAHDGHRVSVHVVDNASPGDDAARLRGAWEARGWGARVALRAETVNHGFGRANNLVLRALAQDPAPPDYAMLLNPDAQLRNETVAILADFLDGHAAAAVAGARIYNPGDPEPATAAFRFPSLASEFAAAVAFGPVSRLFRGSEVALDGALPRSRVDWVSGAAVMARLEAWHELGFFDPAFFLYYEEVDLIRRTVSAGWECWYVPEAEVVHVEGAATQVRSSETERSRRPAYWYHSWQHYFRKTHGRPYALAAASAWVAGAALNHVIALLRGRRPAAPRRFFADFWAAGLRPLLGLGPRDP